LITATAWTLVALVTLWIVSRLMPCQHDNLGRAYMREGSRVAPCWDCGAVVEQPSLEIAVDRCGREVRR
jgi:hypothetical protein